MWVKYPHRTTYVTIGNKAGKVLPFRGISGRHFAISVVFQCVSQHFRKENRFSPGTKEKGLREKLPLYPVSKGNDDVSPWHISEIGERYTSLLTSPGRFSNSSSSCFPSVFALFPPRFGLVSGTFYFLSRLGFVSYLFKSCFRLDYALFLSLLCLVSYSFTL